MAITRIQGANGINATGATSTTATSAFASPTTAGNTIIVGLTIDGGIYTSITDTGGNKYRRITKVAEKAGSQTGVEIWIAESITAVTSNVVTANQGFSDGTIFAEEWSGLASLGSVDRIASGTGKTLSYTTGATAITQYPNELLFVCANQDISGTTNFTVGSGFSNFTTNRSNFVVGAIESQVVSSAGTLAGTMTSDNSGVSGAIVIVTFSDTSVRPSFQPNRLRPHPFSPGLAR